MSKWLTQLPFTINLVLIVLIMITLAQWSWLLLPSPPMESPLTNISSLSNKPTLKILPPIQNWHLFGTSQQNPTKYQQTRKTTNAPETKLKLQLHGIIASDITTDARAIISSQNQDKLYAIGDKVPGNATIIEIYTNHIVLQRNGRNELLRLLSDKIKSITATTLSPKPPTIRPTTKRLRLTDLNQLVHAEPSYQNEQLIGFKISPKGRGKQRIFDQFGLINGDVITELNGIPLNSFSKSMQAIKQLSPDQPVQLSLLRNDRSISLTVNLNEH